ncbi:MAG: hypothetical protein EPN79_11765 [Burkholderiaceae bacterium]|nr:MAG: hypothetical protein EPN79_11765 [Burkholderiaceae bacterium]TBR76666.1 MAG: hypothetical protein EPN64_05300 [Burkholderiaceae bacterium]
MATARKPVDWHWPRTDLAQHYIRMFEVVGAHSMVLFAPRGKGKTEFMTKDVLPAADAAGLFPIYVNFWDNNESPALSMRYAILRAAGESNLLAKMREAMSRGKADVTFGVNIGVAKLDVKGSLDKPQAEESILFNLRQLTDAVCKHGGKKILFVFDEVQTLALKPEHETFIRSLRTLLDERRDKVCSVFTGSSQSRLTEIFSRIKSPLYNFAQQQEFPPLGDAFLEHWRLNIDRIMGGVPKLSLKHMREAFALTDRNPRIFWTAVMDMIQTNATDIVAFAQKAAQATGENSGMRQRLAELSVLDLAVLREIVVDAIEHRDGRNPKVLQLFSAPSRAKFKAEIGMTPTPAQIQGSLRRLMSNDIQLVVSKGRGEYEIEDPFYLDWLQEELVNWDSRATIQAQEPGQGVSTLRDDVPEDEPVGAPRG